jgi:hypothetical protein
VALGTLLLLSILLSKFTANNMAAVQQALTDDSIFQSVALLVAIRHPNLWVTMQIRVAIILGIVFLMMMKSGLIESLLAITAAAILGLMLSIRTFIHTRAQQQANNAPYLKTNIVDVWLTCPRNSSP